MLEWYGSNDSLLPSICDVDTVGIGATVSELRRPTRVMRALSASQSYMPLNNCGYSHGQRTCVLSRHRSNCNCPRLAGLPWNALYGPCAAASSQDSVIAAWYMVSNIAKSMAAAVALANGMRNLQNTSAKPCTPIATGFNHSLLCWHLRTGY